LELACELRLDVVDNGAMLILGTKENDLGIFADADGVTRGPVEEVTLGNRFLLSVGVGYDDLALELIAPVGRLAKVVLKALEERGEVGTFGHGKEFPGDRSVAGGVAEAGLLAGDRPGEVDSERYFGFVGMHNRIPLLRLE